MKFVASIAMTEPAFVVPLARAAEDAGFDMVAVPDSIAYPRESDSTYPYTPDGRREFLENKPLVEPLIAIATMAAATTRIEFVTNVLKLPVRHPVIFAKEVTTLAVLSQDRVVLGVGTSPWPDDYEIVGLPWEGRGRRFEECVEIVRGLSTGRYFEYAGEHYRLPAIKLNPAPSVPIPFLIGGHGDINLRRAARLGDGWISAGMSDEQLDLTLRRLHEWREEYGR
ncbi:MAG TPA: TIGR03619 family F420-dependent LLM class oxidoreductase, partial [Acidimicrobiales bacterium]|nr:TIGR03619 family F420-dependent LLM class oxidoreductase [Acidimicrobiales bacterium]